MIIKANSNHLQQILELNAKIGKFMSNKGFNHWGEHYPTEAIYRRDIMKGIQYVYIIDKIVRGMVSFDTAHHENFDRIEWGTDNSMAYYVHRLAVDPLYQGIGIANNLMRFVEKSAKEGGFDTLRLGAFSGYEDIVRFYKKRGYSIKGEVLFDVSDTPFYGMEKIL